MSAFPDSRAGSRESDAADDAAVIERVLAGDIEQYEQLVRRYQAALYRHAVGMVLDHDAAADMVQDAFVRAYTHLRRCRDRKRFRAWLFQTLRNRCFDYLKDARRKDVRLDDDASVFDHADEPGEMVERKELRSQITRALAALPQAQREAFVIHHIEQISYETMDELLDAKISALKMRVMRAREALTVVLRPQEVTKSLAARLSIRRDAAKEHS